MLRHRCILRDTQKGRKCFGSLAFLGVPGQNQWLPHPCFLGGQKEGTNATPPLHLRGLPNKGGQNHRWLPHPCLLGSPKEGKKCYISSEIPKQRGAKSQVVASPLPSRGPKRGSNCYVTLAFLGIPKQIRRKSEAIASRLPGGPKEGRNDTPHLHSRGSPINRGQNQIGRITLAFLGSQGRAEMLCHPCILGDPRTNGEKI